MMGAIGTIVFPTQPFSYLALKALNLYLFLVRGNTWNRVPHFGPM